MDERITDERITYDVREKDWSCWTCGWRLSSAYGVMSHRGTKKHKRILAGIHVSSKDRRKSSPSQGVKIPNGTSLIIEQSGIWNDAASGRLTEEINYQIVD